MNNQESIKKKLNRLHDIVSKLPDDYVCPKNSTSVFEWNKEEILWLIDTDLKDINDITRFKLSMQTLQLYPIVL